MLVIGKKLYQSTITPISKMWTDTFHLFHLNMYGITFALFGTIIIKVLKYPIIIQLIIITNDNSDMRTMCGFEGSNILIPNGVTDGFFDCSFVDKKT